MKLTQPVLIQSLEDVYEIDHSGPVSRPPEAPGQEASRRGHSTFTE